MKHAVIAALLRPTRLNFQLEFYVKFSAKFWAEFWVQLWVKTLTVQGEARNVKLSPL